MYDEYLHLLLHVYIKSTEPYQKKLNQNNILL